MLRDERGTIEHIYTDKRDNESSPGLNGYSTSQNMAIPETME